MAASQALLCSMIGHVSSQPEQIPKWLLLVRDAGPERSFLIADIQAFLSLDNQREFTEGCSATMSTSHGRGRLQIRAVVPMLPNVACTQLLEKETL